MVERLVVLAGVVAMAIAFAGCAVGRPELPRPGWREAGVEWGVTVPSISTGTSWRRVPYLSASGMSVASFGQWLAEAGQSVVYDQGVASKEFTGEFRGESLDIMVQAVARSVGVQATRLGRTWYLGTLRSEDRATYVGRIGRLPADELRAVLGGVTSEMGRVEVTADGVVSVADRVEVLGRVVELMAAVERVPVGTWVVQVLVLGQEDRDEFEAGVRAAELGSLAGALVVNGAGVAASGVIDLGLESVVRAAWEQGSARVVTAPTVVLADGDEAEVSEVVRTPIRQRTVSAYGVSSEAGFADVETGLRLKVALRESGGKALVRVKLEASEALGERDGVPIRRSRGWTGSGWLPLGRAALLGSLEVRQASDAVWGPVLGGSRRLSRETWSVWVQVLAGPVFEGEELVGADGGAE